MEEKITMAVMLKYNEPDREWTAEVKSCGITEHNIDQDGALTLALLSIREMFQDSYGTVVNISCMPVSQKFEVGIEPRHNRTLGEFPGLDEADYPELGKGDCKIQEAIVPEDPEDGAAT